MTCREKLKIEHPEYECNDRYIDPWPGCPHEYGYVPMLTDKECHAISCAACWNRELPKNVDDLHKEIIELQKQIEELDEVKLFKDKKEQLLQLNDKMDKLIDFKDSEKFNKLSENQQNLLNTQLYIMMSYMSILPIIMACSMAVPESMKIAPFKDEYIIPQLLMQWVRNEICIKENDDYNELVGIRYFSCASVKASDMGFNYVFPTSGNPKSADLPYCSVLAKAFRLTNPVYIHEYDSLSTCEWQLTKSNDFDFIN